MTYLVDANILSEATRPVPAAQVVAWLRNHQRDLVVDPIILGELRFGILLLPASRKRTTLEHWFDAGARLLPCLPWEASTGQVWASLLARLRKSGKAMPIKDSLIAATALTHDVTVATRNVADFRKAGVRVVNPFEG